MSFMRAEDLRKSRDESESRQRFLYDKVMNECAHRIQRVWAQSRSEYTFYCVPFVIAGEPMYDWRACVQHVKVALREHGYSVKLHKDQHTLFISWDKSVEKKAQDVKKPDEKKTPAGKTPDDKKSSEGSNVPSDGKGERKREEKKASQRNHEHYEEEIDFNPRDPLSQLNLRARLMAANTKYQHLQSVQALKRRR